jgi:hypothetical protein
MPPSFSLWLTALRLSSPEASMLFTAEQFRIKCFI